MHPTADLRAAVLDLNHVPNETPVELTFAFGAPNALVYDEPNNVVRLSIGWGRATGRPTMGQLRSWLSLPTVVAPEVAPTTTPVTTGVAGVWDSLNGQEPFTLRGAITFASAAISGFHGARRNGGSIGWGLWWFMWGAALPGLIPIVAVAQGYGDCRNNCTPSKTERR